MNETLYIQDIIKLAEGLNLPYILREEELTICGELQLIVFKRQENNTCQVPEIY